MVEIWWLIEKPKTDDSGNTVNQFFDGMAFVESALKAARFPSKEAAQFIIDEIYGPSNHNMMESSYPVEHGWFTQ